MEKTDGRCPNCRREYDVENFDFTPPAPEECVALFLKTSINVVIKKF